jgi:hypothetical protein
MLYCTVTCAITSVSFGNFASLISVVIIVDFLVIATFAFVPNISDNVRENSAQSHENPTSIEGIVPSDQTMKLSE